MLPTLDSCRPKPFYFLTTSDPAEYSDEAIRAALLEVKECGFGGIVFFNKPPTGFTEKEYLSDFWFEVSEKFIINCLDLGLEFWVNDGFNYPPGDAAGRIAEVAPELKQYRLRPNPEGKLITEETDWAFPAFEEPESSRLFIHFVYEEYYKRLGKYFGKGITGFFSDADNRRINSANSRKLGGERYYPWSRNFAGDFQKRFGYDISGKLKELFTESDPQVVSDYWRFSGELYQQWFANNYAWCKAHNVKYTFHTSDTGPLNVENCARSSAFSEGEPLTLLANSDYPGTDHEIEVLDGGTHYDSRLFFPKVSLGSGEELLDHPAFNDTSMDIRAKLAGSAAYLKNAPGAMCEMFAATNWGTNYNMLSRIAAWQVIQGVCFIVPHAVHYRFFDWAKFFAPPEFIHGTMRAGVREFNDRLAKWCQAVSAGKYLAEVAVIEPTHKVWLGKESKKFFEICDKLNRQAIGYVIIPADQADKFPVVIDPFADELPELPAPCASFTGGEVAWMPREVDGEKYILAANIWSDKTLAGIVEFNGRKYDVEIAPGEIAVFGGPLESYRCRKESSVVKTFDQAVKVDFVSANVIPFEKELEFEAEEALTLSLNIPRYAGKSAEFDGKALTGFAETKIFDDAYYFCKLDIKPGKHRITLAESAKFDTPAWLEGDFDLSLETSGDFAEPVKNTYMLRIYAPESAKYTLAGRRTHLKLDSGWEKQGQLFYSGEVIYDLGSDNSEAGEFLELPGFCGTAELLIDGKSASKCAFAPYRFPLIPGEHDLKLRCWNSMGNRMERYAAPSGLTTFPEKRK